MQPELECPICASRAGTVLFEEPAVPVWVGVQWPDADSARNCPKGAVQLRFCSDCGFIWNHAFDPRLLDYTHRYDNALDFSEVFLDYEHRLVKRLIDAYGICGKNVIEIGCGGGRFLSRLCEAGHNRGVGFDPSLDGGTLSPTENGHVRFIKDQYSEQYACFDADLICCRHVLEHIRDPVNFLKMLKRATGGRDTMFYFEVPGVRVILEQFSIWDIIYEHCSYFSAESLSHLFHGCGFRIERLANEYRNQFLALDARLLGRGETPAAPAFGNLSSLRTAVGHFADAAQHRMADWSRRLAQYTSEKRRVVLWGAGAKAVGFSSLVGVTEEMVPFAVDINPAKQGRYLPGGQRILEPNALRAVRPDIVILMNPIYRSEVSRQLSDIGLAPEIVEAF
jgi:SAM-dependent methyltransferase